MGVTHGNDGIVKIGANAVAEIQSWTLNEEISLEPTAAMGATAKTYIAGGPTGWSVEIECNWDDADTTGQDLMTVGSTVALTLYPQGDASGDKTRAGNAIIESVSEEVSKDGVITASFSGQGTGTLTRGAVV